MRAERALALPATAALLSKASARSPGAKWPLACANARMRSAAPVSGWCKGKWPADDAKGAAWAVIDERSGDAVVVSAGAADAGSGGMLAHGLAAITP